MLVEIIKFRAALKGFKRTIWREIEIKDTEKLDTFIYTLLSAFNTTGTHLFSLDVGGQAFEFHQNPPYWDDQFTIEPNKIKLSQLNILYGDTMTLIYDFGSDWEFDITVKGFRQIDSSTRFPPTIINGKGYGIIEDIYPWDLKALIDETNRTGKPTDMSKVLDEYYDDDYDEDEEDLEDNNEDEEIEVPWDYREFDLEKHNKRLKDDIKTFREWYKHSN